jgi:hypothetical protein
VRAATKEAKNSSKMANAAAAVASRCACGWRENVSTFYLSHMAMCMYFILPLAASECVPRERSTLMCKKFTFCMRGSIIFCAENRSVCESRALFDIKK